MVNRTAGRRLRNLARQRRRQVVREHGVKLMMAAAVWLAGWVTISLVFAWAFGRGWGIFMMGTATGALIAFGVMVFTVFDGEGARLTDGADAESFTAGELRKLRREGWRAVHNIPFERGDVDHVAVGPGGVFAIETKTSGASWDFLVQHAKPEHWARQARDGAFRVRYLIKQVASTDVPPTPVVASWIHGQPDEANEVIDGVWHVRGHLLRQYLRQHPTTLTPEQVDGIYRALSTTGEQWDERLGIEHHNLLRRIFA